MKTRLHYWKLFMMLLSIGVTGAFFTSCDDEEKPQTVPTVTTVAVTEITTTTAKGGGEITSDGNATVTASGLVYSSVVAEPTIADDKTAATATSGTFTSLMEDLESGTTYHVRAYATNSVGTAYGAVVNFATSNAAPVATNVSITGDIQVNKELTATYVYSDSDDDAEGETTFQWYQANDNAGADEAAIAGATELTYTIEEALQSKYIRVGVTPKATTGNTTGTEVKSAFFGAVGEATTVTFMYNGQSVTYGIITTSTGRKWMDRNLGAPNMPAAYDDYANYGDLFQWGRLADGHQLTVRTGGADENVSGPGNTSTVLPYDLSATDDPGHSLFIVTGTTAPNDWHSPQNDNLWQGVNGINNPCPSASGWRIPTSEEWLAEDLGTIEQAYTKLKITLSGIRAGDSGDFFQTTTNGRYWTSTIDPNSPTGAMRTSVNSGGTTPSSTGRSNAYPCRCIKD